MQQSRYSLQVVKCDNPRCCKQFKTDWHLVFPERFIPPPSIYKYDSAGVIAVETENYLNYPNSTQNSFEFAPLQKRLLLCKKTVEGSEYVKIPFDLYCPSMKDKLTKGICPICESYWPSTAAMRRHKKCHKPQKSHTVSDEEETDDESEQSPQVVENDRPMPIFENIFEILQSPFVEE